MPTRTRRIAALLFASGFSALVYQTARQPHAPTRVRSVDVASSAVLGIFLGGLGLNGHWLGKRAERSARPPAFLWPARVGDRPLGGSHAFAHRRRRVHLFPRRRLAQSRSVRRNGPAAGPLC